MSPAPRPRPIAPRAPAAVAAAAAIVAVLLTAGTAPAAAADEFEGHRVLQKHCVSCHGETQKFPGLDFRDRAVALSEGGLDVDDPEFGGAWRRAIEDGDMPPKDVRPRPTEAELKALDEWLRAGAPYPGGALPEPDRTFVTPAVSFAAMTRHVRAAAPEDRPYLRFFSLAHAHNDPSVSSEKLRLERAALSKAVNSLSWEPRIAQPAVVATGDPGADGALLCVDLRDLGWDRRGAWPRILAAYPYGVRYDTAADPALSDAAREVYAATGTPIPAVRADWFVASALRPPLYHDLADIPETDAELERRLGVDVASDFARDRLQRAGFVKSGVSAQNRLVDRHDSRFGGYWKSYDFAPGKDRGNLFKFPLGPDFGRAAVGDDYSPQAFEHDGGEIVFTLPNGLHGYMLVKDDGTRIDAGPTAIVFDPNGTSGGPEIVTGLSCMACHTAGVIKFPEDVRTGAGVFGQARRKVDRLYPTLDRWERVLDRDRADYLAALDRAAGPFFRGEAAPAGLPPTVTLGDPIEAFPEPVKAVAARYQVDLNAAAAAAELGLEGGADELAAAIRFNNDLRGWGLGPLAHGGTIPRDQWDNLGGFTSVYQRTAQALDLGTPYREFRD